MWKFIFNRFNNLFKSKAMSALDSVENPVEMYALAVHESEKNLQSMTKAIALALADQKSKERELNQALLETESWKAKAKAAIAQNHAELARTALEHKAIAEKKAEEYHALNEMLKAKIEDQKQQLKRFKMKHEELKAKKSIYAAKYETAKAQKNLAESLGGLNNTALSEVSRLEEKINKLEAESEALLELTDAENHEVMKLEESFTSYKIEEDFQALQAQVAEEKSEKSQSKMKQIENELLKNNNKQNKANEINEFYSLKPKASGNNEDINKFFNQ